MDNKRNNDTRKSRERRKKEQQIRQIRHALIFTLLIILALMYAAARKELEAKNVKEAEKTEAAGGKTENNKESGKSDAEKVAEEDKKSGGGDSGKGTAGQEASAQGNLDKNTSDKAASDKAASNKVDSDKNASEKPSSEKSTSEKPNSEKSNSEKPAGSTEPAEKTPSDTTGDGLILEEEDMWALYLTNEQYPVPDDQQINLVQVPETEQTVDERIYEPLMKMIEDARAQGMRIHMCSGYRTKEKQTELFENKVQSYMREGKTEEEAYNLAKRSISVPNSGEHRLGLAADFISDTYKVLEEGFADTPEGQWLREHCTEYGFILRYPKEKEEMTGISYEPWHFRYVGVKVAEYMKEHDMCLEEFYVAQSLYG